jgi:hypothetical protein
LARVVEPMTIANLYEPRLYEPGKHTSFKPRGAHLKLAGIATLVVAAAMLLLRKSPTLECDLASAATIQPVSPHVPIGLLLVRADCRSTATAVVGTPLCAAFPEPRRRASYCCWTTSEVILTTSGGINCSEPSSPIKRHVADMPRTLTANLSIF